MIAGNGHERSLTDTYLRDDGEAENAVQDISLRMLQRRPVTCICCSVNHQLRSRSQCSDQTCGCQCLFLTALTRHARERNMLRLWESSRQSQICMDDVGVACACCWLAEDLCSLRMALRAAVDRLPDHLNAVVRLSYWGECDPTAIGVILNRPTHRILSWRETAIRLLRIDLCGCDGLSRPPLTGCHKTSFTLVLVPSWFPLANVTATVAGKRVLSASLHERRLKS